MKFKILILFFILFIFFEVINFDFIYGDEDENNYRIYSICIDFKPLFLSIQTEGFGYGFFFEYFLNQKLSLLLRNEYMNFISLNIWLIDLMFGVRLYFRNAYSGLFFGTYFIIFYGSKPNLNTFTWGFNVELGYRFLLLKEFFKKNIKVFLEIYLEFNYLYKEEIIYGISPGFCIGFNF
ncbi:MAG: hypothetical protein N3A58_07360 [Spirochaetes bacterium]|nr:hypothetical protein [Spirochaetota bacterium]